jgi:hypothetical protein
MLHVTGRLAGGTVAYSNRETAAGIAALARCFGTDDATSGFEELQTGEGEADPLEVRISCPELACGSGGFAGLAGNGGPGHLAGRLSNSA